MTNEGQTGPPFMAMGHDASDGRNNAGGRENRDDRMPAADDGEDALEQVLVRLARSASLEQLVPEIRRAVDKARRHDRAVGLNQALSLVADQGGLPFVLLSMTGEIRFVSPLAETLVAREPALQVEDRCLELCPGALDRQLRDVLAHLDTGGSTRGALDSVVHVARADGRPDLQLLLRPLSGRAVHDAVPMAYAAMFLHDPEANFEVDAFRLAALFDLSYAEARVTSYLASGYSLAATAEHLHLSIHTVRAELKAVFRKTGVSSQTGLIRVVLTSPACRFGTPPLF